MAYKCKLFFLYLVCFLWINEDKIKASEGLFSNSPLDFYIGTTSPIEELNLHLNLNVTQGSAFSNNGTNNLSLKGSNLGLQTFLLIDDNPLIGIGPNFTKSWGTNKFVNVKFNSAFITSIGIRDKIPLYFFSHHGLAIGSAPYFIKGQFLLKSSNRGLGIRNYSLGFHYSGSVKNKHSSFKNKKKELILKRSFGMLTGMGASALSHEFGHGLAAISLGGKFKWPVYGSNNQHSTLILPDWQTTFNQPLTKNESILLNSSGFISNAIFTETLLFNKKSDKMDPFNFGVILYDTGNSLFYVINDIRLQNKNGGFGDFKQLRNKGNVRRGVLYSLLLTRSAINLTRLIKKSKVFKKEKWIIEE